MKRLSLAIIIIALLLCGCEEGYSPDQPPIETLTQSPTPTPMVTQEQNSPSQWIKNTPASTPKEPEIDEIQDYIELGFKEEVFEPSRPELNSVDLSGDELYVEYTSNRHTDSELFNEMHEVATLIEEAFTGYQKPGRVTIKAIPPKQYNYETSLLWNEFIKLSSGEMPISEWSHNTARSG